MIVPQFINFWTFLMKSLTNEYVFLSLQKVKSNMFLELNINTTLNTHQ